MSWVLLICVYFAGGAAVAWTTVRSIPDEEFDDTSGVAILSVGFFLVIAWLPLLTFLSPKIYRRYRNAKKD